MQIRRGGITPIPKKEKEEARRIIIRQWQRRKYRKSL